MILKMDKKTGNDFNELCLKAIDTNGVFASMGRLMFQTKIISLNAEIASVQIGDLGLPFGVVVKELGLMSENLSALVNEVDRIDHVLASNIAKGLNAKRRMELYQRAISSLRSANNEATFSRSDHWNQALAPGVGEEWLGAMESMEEGSLERTFMNLILTNRKAMLATLATLSRMSREIEKLIGTVAIVAGRQSHFVAIAASVEAANIGEVASDLVTVAKDIKDLAKKIDSVGQSATERIGLLLALEYKVCTPIRKEISTSVIVSHD